jgi:parallel beta-helix repeat protein
MRIPTNWLIWIGGVIAVSSLLLVNGTQERALPFEETQLELSTQSATSSLKDIQLYSQAPMPPIPGFKPIVELTVCIEGPPSCQFKHIQDAINAAPDVHGVLSWETPPELPLIRVSSGVYDEQIQIIAKSVWLRGEGRVTLRSGILVVGFGKTAIGIEGMTTQGGIGVVGEVSGVIAKNNINGTIALTGALTNLMIRNNIIGGAAIGIFLQGVSPSSTLGRGLAGDASVFIAENEIFEHTAAGGGEGIWVKDAKEVAIVSNRIYKNRSWGIFLQKAEANISANIFEANGGGIQAYDSRVSIVGNRIERHGYTAISVSGGEYFVRMNQLRNNKGEGIEVGIEAAVQVVENIIANNRTGLSVARLSDIKVCKSNQISENQVNYADIALNPNEELRKQCERL